MCASLAPDLFRIDDNGKAESRNIEAEFTDTVEDAIDQCPMLAVVAEEPTSGERLWTKPA
jgi:ferredoxin